MSLLAHDHAGPTTDGTPHGPVVVLLHAAVADRRMWDPIWSALTAEHEVVRVDLRGFGESTERPAGPLSPVDDVLATLDRLGVQRCHLVGASYGAGVAVEVALTRPDLVASLVLVAPGGSLIGEVTPDLRAFWDAERAALEAGDVEAAVAANVRGWVDGPRRGEDVVDPSVRALVAHMQRLAFDLTADWDDVAEAEPDPSPLDRLEEIKAPTLVLVGGEDISAIQLAADRVSAAIAHASRVDWDDVAHLPSMERPAEFVSLLSSWLAGQPTP